MRRGPLSATPYCYLLVELPDVLPLPIEPELEPVLGVVVLGDVVLGDVLDEPLEEPLMPEPVLVPPLELELEPLLKCASHSAREIWPSLLVSTDEKLGCELLLPELELGEVVLDDEPPAAPVDDLLLDDEPADELPVDELPLADGEAEDGLDEEDEESAAAAARERAKSAAAVVTVTVLIIGVVLCGLRMPPIPRKLRAASSLVQRHD